MMSFQYWLGGSPENLQSMLLNVAAQYVAPVYETAGLKLVSADLAEYVAEPVLLPDKGIWHPMAPSVYQTATEYFKWYEQEHVDFAELGTDAPVVGVVLQKRARRVSVLNSATWEWSFETGSLGR